MERDELDILLTDHRQCRTADEAEYRQEILAEFDALREERDVLKKAAVDDDLTLDEYADELGKIKSRLALADAIVEAVESHSIGRQLKSIKEAIAEYRSSV